MIEALNIWFKCLMDGEYVAASSRLQIGGDSIDVLLFPYIALK
jgi:hypothetical protein